MTKKQKAAKAKALEDVLKIMRETRRITIKMLLLNQVRKPKYAEVHFFLN